MKNDSTKSKRRSRAKTRQEPEIPNPYIEAGCSIIRRYKSNKFYDLQTHKYVALKNVYNRFVSEDLIVIDPEGKDITGWAVLFSLLKSENKATLNEMVKPLKDVALVAKKSTEEKLESGASLALEMIFSPIKPPPPKSGQGLSE